MKVVMVDGPKNGEVITVQQSPGEVVCFPFVRPVSLSSFTEEFDPHSTPLPDTLVYRRRGRVVWETGIIDVYTFDGVQ